MVLLAICIGALLIGVLRLATQETPMPAGSSYSPQPDGALALYSWVQAVGGSPVRVSDPTTDDTVKQLVIIQPAALTDRSTRDAFDAVAQRGGTLVLAGDSIQWLIYVEALGINAEPVTPESPFASASDGLLIPFNGRYRLRAQGAEPLLVRDRGDWVAVRKPYRHGTLIVIASPDPLTNAGLADSATARFVYREIVAPAVGQTLAFDEMERSFAPTAPGAPSANQLLFGTSPGRALIYAALLTFAFLLLGGRRLGPALVGRPAAESQRTMYEHVQMLANLYRRAGQFSVVRTAFGRHYARPSAHGGSDARRNAIYAEALARVHTARTESELVAAVADIDDAR